MLLRSVRRMAEEKKPLEIEPVMKILDDEELSYVREDVEMALEVAKADVAKKAAEAEAKRKEAMERSKTATKPGTSSDTASDTKDDIPKTILDAVESLWKEGYKEVKDLADLVLSRTKVETNTGEVARAIDQLVKSGKITMEPKVPPEAVASLPAEQGEVAPATTAPVTSPADGTNTGEAGASSQPPPVTEEVPTEVAVEAYVRPLIAKGITMTDLRHKIGYEKGKPWTAMLNRIVDHIVDLSNHHVTAPNMYRTLKTEYHTTMGSVIAAVVRLPRNADRTIIANWEKEILCSNPKGGAKGDTKGVDKDAVKKLQGEGAGAGQMVDLVLPEVDGTDSGPVRSGTKHVLRLSWSG